MPQRYPNLHVRRERDPRAARRQLLLVACCLALAAGFVLAARQQIAAVQYGYQSEDLRRERDRLLEEQRRLRLTLEEHASPSQLERAARALGLQPVRAAQIETAAARAGRQVETVHSPARVSPAAARR